jgi:hypothetical protein
MNKHEKIFLGAIISIALINFYMQYTTQQKMQEVKNELKNQQ